MSYGAGVQKVMYAALGSSLPAVGSDISWSSPGTAANEVQTLTLSGSPTGGTFTLGFGGYETANIDYDATGNEVEGALEDIASIGNGNVSVTGASGGPWVVTFTRDLGSADQAILTLEDNSLSGGSEPSVGIVETTPGTPGGATWTELIFDGDDAVELGIDGNMELLRPGGKKRPTVAYVVDVALESVKIKNLESGEDLLSLIFPEFTVSSHVMEMSAKNQQATPIALALETTLGVIEVKAVVPDQKSVLKLAAAVTRPDVNFMTLENSAGSVASYHFFT